MASGGALGAKHKRLFRQPVIGVLMRFFATFKMTNNECLLLNYVPFGTPYLIVNSALPNRLGWSIFIPGIFLRPQGHQPR